MKNNVLKTLVLVGVLGLAGCASAPEQPQASGFLPDYSLLKPVPTKIDNVQHYSYINPAVDKTKYTAVIVEPVMLYQTAVAHGVNEDQIEKAREQIDAGIKQIVSEKMPITTAAGPGIARLKIAITGATDDNTGFSPLNIIPISAAIKLASRATDLDSKQPVLVLELKVVDSVSGQLLREDVTVINGDTFRDRANTASAFTELAQKWVKDALQYMSAAGQASSH